jgi:glycerol-3-phosphate O-acyltransferase
MDKQPWHAVSACETLIVLLDVAHAVEQEELERYLAESLRHYAVAATVHRVALPIARDPENPPTTSLRPLLSLPEHTCVLPLRVVWRTSLEEKSSRPRPRDLLFGTLRRPGPWRARSIRRQHPERVVCIAGEPASIGDLRARLEAQRGEAVDDDVLATFVATQAGLALDVAERRLQGSRYKVPRSVATTLLGSARFRSAVENISRDTGRSVDELTRESEDIMRELISRPQPFWLDVMAQLNHWVMSPGLRRRCGDRSRRIWSACVSGRGSTPRRCSGRTRPMSMDLRSTPCVLTMTFPRRIFSAG